MCNHRWLKIRVRIAPFGLQFASGGGRIASVMSEAKKESLALIEESIKKIKDEEQLKKASLVIMGMSLMAKKEQTK